ncbi:MAG: class I SAM-dependent methyltransferase [Bacteroidetes bacterium]|nr:class I SAM-dependent methyltransferase [Bacteroidota bacterium]
MNARFNERLKALEYKVKEEGHDGRANIEILNLFLKPGSSVLEIGMGPGTDLDIIAENHRVTGSDISPAFIEMVRDKHPNLELLKLDAVSLKTNRKFDCIYSNKVLHQLSREELKLSFKRQFDILNPEGLVCHSMWFGDKEVVYHNQKFQYYSEVTLPDYLNNNFEILFHKKYMEMVPDDSIIFVLKQCS